ncbi:MAG: hypothetical protein ABFC57_12055 [Veillonellales bacterium]
MAAESIRYQARVVFVADIHSCNYREAIEEKRKQYEADGWELHADQYFSEFKVTDSGSYRVILTRRIQGGEAFV